MCKVQQVKMYCCSWWTFFNLTESNTLKKLPQAHINHLVDSEMQSLLPLTIQIICIFQKCFLCNMLRFQRNTLDWTFSQHFEKYRGYSITPKPSTNHQHEDLLQHSKHFVILKPQRTGMHKFYTVLKKLLIYNISEISIF